MGYLSQASFSKHCQAFFRDEDTTFSFLPRVIDLNPETLCCVNIADSKCPRTLMRSPSSPRMNWTRVRRDIARCTESTMIFEAKSFPGFEQCLCRYSPGQNPCHHRLIFGTVSRYLHPIIILSSAAARELSWLSPSRQPTIHHTQIVLLFSSPHTSS